jgi:hypothetical protein
LEPRLDVFRALRLRAARLLRFFSSSRQEPLSSRTLSLGVTSPRVGLQTASSTSEYMK